MPEVSSIDPAKVVQHSQISLNSPQKDQPRLFRFIHQRESFIPEPHSMLPDTEESLSEPEQELGVFHTEPGYISDIEVRNIILCLMSRYK